MTSRERSRAMMEWTIAAVVAALLCWCVSLAISNDRGLCTNDPHGSVCPRT